MKKSVTGTRPLSGTSFAAPRSRPVYSFHLSLPLLIPALLCLDAVSGEIAESAGDILADSDTVEGEGLCTVSIYAAPYWGCCDAVSVSVSSIEEWPPGGSYTVQVPCGSEIILTAHESPQCRFYYWWNPYPCPHRGACLPVGGSYFEPIWVAEVMDNDSFVAYFMPLPLTIAVQPEGAAVYEDMSCRLQTSVQDTVGEPHYDWKRDNRSLGAPDRPYLEIPRVWAPVAGEFWCRISDNCKSVDTDHVRIDVFPRADEGHHAVDTDRDWQISLHELLRVVQFYNMGEYHCEEATEDGYAPGPGETTCTAHDADYETQDWQIAMNELLRIVQFFNAPGGAYHAEPGTEDSFAPQAG